MTMLKPRVLLTLPMHPEAEAALSEFAEVLRAPDVRPATLLEWGRQADAIIVRAQLPDDLFARCPRLRIAVRHGTGMDMIPLEQAEKHGVALARVPGVNAKTVAEYALWALLGARRKLFSVIHPQRQAQPNPWVSARAFADQGHDMDGYQIGIVGCGQVGQSLARMLTTLWDVQLRIFSRSPLPPALQTPAVQACSLDEVLAHCDAVVLALPLTAQTHHLLNAERLQRMRRGATLINVARGAIVDPEALRAALNQGQLGWAVLDVFPVQPLTPDDAWWQQPGALITPHVAGVSDESMRRMGLGAVQAVRELWRARGVRKGVGRKAKIDTAPGQI